MMYKILLLLLAFTLVGCSQPVEMISLDECKAKTKEAMYLLLLTSDFCQVPQTPNED